jgi:pilus assembly protein CpaB
MAASRVIILGVAVAAAGGAGYVAKNMSAAPPAEIVVAEGPRQPSIALTEVLVVSGDVPMGAPVGDQLAWQEWPSNGVSGGFITKSDDPGALDELRTAIARVPIYAGEPLRRNKLVGDGKSFMSSILPAGKRAIATQISADTSAGGFILPNDFVDVIMTRRADATAGGAATGFVTETILKNIKVLAIDQTIQEDEEGKKVKVGETATLELTPQQAEIITVAQQMADRLSLSLRSVEDAQESSDGGSDYLVSGNGRRGTVRLIKSGEVSEVGARK